MSRPVDKKRKWRTLIFLGVLSLLAVLLGTGFYFYLYFDFHPRNRVAITVADIPPGTHFLSFVIESDGKIEPMYWYSGMFRTSPMHPLECIWSFRFPDDGPILKHKPFLVWKWGDRYGVIRRQTDKTWWVTWFEATSVPLRGRDWFFGGGAAHFPLAQGKTEPLPMEQVRRLGLGDVRRSNE